MRCEVAQEHEHVLRVEIYGPRWRILKIIQRRRLNVGLSFTLFAPRAAISRALTIVTEDNSISEPIKFALNSWAFRQLAATRCREVSFHEIHEMKRIKV